jgi:RNA polymerase sigma-70 factor (ECF subfamily)
MREIPAQSRLRQFIESESGALVNTLRGYLYRAGLTAQPLDAAANELLNEVVVQALEHEERFQFGGQPRAWLLGIAANLIKRQQSEIARRERREPLVSDLYPNADLGEDELFDWIADTSAEELEMGDGAAVMLALVSPDDQHVLRLAILNDMNGDALAAALGITPGAARVRLHRALNRLRAAYVARKEARDV